MIAFDILWMYVGAGAVLAVLAWALVYIARSRNRKVENTNQAYVEGLRSLLDGDITHGVAKLRQAVSEDTENIDAYIRLGDLLRKSGHSTTALRVHKTLLQRRNLTRDVKIRVKRSLYEDFKRRGELSRATDVLQELISFDTRNTTLRRELLALYEKRGMWEQAIDTTKRLIDRRSAEGRQKIATYQASIGMTLLKNDKEEEGLHHLKSALKTHKDCVPALIYLGDASYSKKNVDEAISYWRRVVETSPKYAFLTLSRIEEALFDQGKFSETKDLYEGFLSTNEGNVSVHDALARIYVKMGKAESAVAEYKKALEIDPYCLSAKVGLARVYAGSGHHENAFNELMTEIKGLKKEVKQYRCSHCGRKSKEFLWVCPGCGEAEPFQV